MSWGNLPVELVIKILVEFDGRFVLRNGRLLFIDKLLKDDARYSMLSPMIPHPKLNYTILMNEIFPTVYLRFSPRKEYVLSLWYTETEGKKIPSTDVILFANIKQWQIESTFIGTF